MATFRNVKGKFHAIIRRKNKSLSATFSDKQTAEIWSKYHEDLIDNMDNFQVSPENYITYEQCLELKIQDAIENNIDKRSIEDLKNSVNHFNEIKDIPIGEITCDILRELVSKMQNSVVKKGGSKENINSGNIRKISQTTILNRLRLLACVFSYMIQNGANMTNPAQIIVNQVKMSISKKDDSLDDSLDDDE